MRDLMGRAMQFFCKEPQRYYMEIASLATTVGIIHEEYQEYEAAVQCYEIAKDIYMEKLGTEHPNTAISYNDLGYALIKLERYEEALRYLKESCRIKEREFGTEHRYTANTYHTLGQAYTGLGDYEKALELKSTKMFVYGHDHINTLVINYNDIMFCYGLKTGRTTYQ